jgi:hypothetical protein
MKILDDIKIFINFYYVDKHSNIESSIDQISNENEFINIIIEILNKINIIDKKNIIYTQDNNGYNIIHYISALDYSNILQLLYDNNFNLFCTTKDNLTTYEICAGKWNANSLNKLIEISDKTHNEDMIFNIEILKSALNIALGNGKNIEKKDVNILDVLLKQIRIQYTTDSSNYVF